MASIGNDPGGRKRILFVAPDGSRKTVRLGKLSRKDAEAVKRHVEALLAARLSGQPVDRQTAVWLGEIGPVLSRRLAACGLIEPAADEEPEPAAAPERTLLGPFLRCYVLGRQDVKPATLEIWSQPVRNLVAFLGEDRRLDSITPGDAEQFKQWLSSQGLATATVAKRLAFARAFFNAALKHRYVGENPFLSVKIPTADVSIRQRFVPRSSLNALFSVASADWRIILALARLGGLRCPSEVLSLEWSQVDWQRARITVPSPKTDRYAGKASRVVPLFVDLLPHLEEARALAPAGQVHVVGGNYLKKAQTPGGWRNVCLHNIFRRLIQKAGLDVWPRLFHNLRSSFETELLQEFPPHVVARWMGHDVQTSMKHYAQVTDEDFARAAGIPAQSGTVPVCMDRKEEGGATGATDQVVQGPVLVSSYGGGGGIRLLPFTAAESGGEPEPGTQSGTLPGAVLTVLKLIDQLTARDRAVLLAALDGRREAA